MSLQEEPQAPLPPFLPTCPSPASTTPAGHLCKGDLPSHLPPGLPLPARGLLIVGLPLMLPVEEAFHLGRCCLLGPGWQGGSTLGRKCRLGLAVRGGRGNRTRLFGARPLLGSTVDHFTCVHGFCHLGTLERPFSEPQEQGVTTYALTRTRGCV